jgi:hypothetical protein
MEETTYLQWLEKKARIEIQAVAKIQYPIKSHGC